MPKEPKLLAEIRANKARVEKEAKRIARDTPAQPKGPLFLGTVETPDTPKRPDNYIVRALDECTTAAHCDELLAHARAHGYDENGQTVQLIHQRIAEHAGGKTTKTNATKRGAR